MNWGVGELRMAANSPGGCLVPGVDIPCDCGLGHTMDMSRDVLFKMSNFLSNSEVVASMQTIVT